MGKLLNNRASILVLAVWALVFLTALNTAIYKLVSGHVQVAKNFKKRIICPYLAKAVYQYVKSQREGDETAYDTLYELGSSRTLAVGRDGCIYFMDDEEGKININTASKEILSRLPGFSDSMAEKIVSSPLRPFALIEEILSVEGITEETFLQVKDFITVYGKGGVNFNTATASVLQALGMDVTLVDIIERYRGGPDGQEMTEDDQVFDATGSIVNDLRNFTGLMEAQEALLAQLISQGLLTVSSGAVSLHVDTFIQQDSALKFVLVMDDGSIKQWKEN